MLTRSRGLALCAAIGSLTTATACGSSDPVVASEPAPALAAKAGGANQPPAIRSLNIDPAQPSIDDGLRAAAAVIDPEGDRVDVTYVWTIDGERVGGSGPELSLSGVSPGANVGVTATPSDGKATGESKSAQVWVIDRPPRMEGIALEPTSSVYPGDRVVVTPTASDPDGDLVEYRIEWFVNDEPAEGDGRSFSSEGLRRGDRIRVRVVASDGTNESRPTESEEILVGSAHPEIVSTPPGIEDTGVFRYEVEATDPDGDRQLRFRLDAAPEGMTIDEVLGVIEWRPTEKQVGDHPVSVVVRDSSGLETKQSFQVTMSSEETPPASAE